MSRRVIENGAQLVLRPNDVAECDFVPFGDINHRSLSLMFVPIRSGEKAIGVLTIQSYSADRYDREKLRTLQALADYCGGAFERIRAEEALRESEQWLTLLAGQTPAIIWAVDRDLRITSLMGAGLALVDLKPDEVLGQTVAERLRDFDSQSDPVWAIQSALEGESLSYEVELRGRAFQTDIEPLRNNDGDIIGVVGIALDITERKRAEQSLAAEKEQLAVTLGSISDGVIATDLEGRVILLNRVAEKLTGWTEGEAAGRHLNEVFQLVREKDRQRCTTPVETVLKTGRATSFTNHTLLIARDGTERVIGHSAAPIKDKDCRKLGVVLAFRDITEQRKHEEEILKTSKLESLGVLAGGIAHEFNNMLAAILGNITLVMSQASQDQVARERLGEAEQACARARELTRQLLTFAGGGAPVKKTVSTSRFLEDTACFALTGSNVRCEFDLAEGLWPIEIDEGLMSQVLHNLARNSQEAMPDGGRIRVRAENVVVDGAALPLLPGRYVKIAVEDEGGGIPEANLNKIFDPYFTTKERSSGLGLATSYSIIKKHSGYIQVESLQGRGTTACIYLPASDCEVEAKREEPEKPHRAGARILVMDDEEILRRLAREILTHFGYESEVASDGAEAIEIYRREKEAGRPFDAVIMDLTVPGGMGGKEAIKRLREIDPEVKAIVSSGYSNDPVLSYFRDYGFDGIVAKPYDIHELVHALDRLLSSDTYQSE
jgi:PAS domain S-box-containing protein